MPAEEKETGEPDELNRLRKEVKKLNRRTDLLQRILERNKAIAAAKAQVSTVLMMERARQNTYMNMVLANSPDIILLFDAEGRFVYCADVFLKIARIDNFAFISGRYYSEVLGRFMTPGVLDEIGDAFRKAIFDKESIIIEEIIDIACDGKGRNYEIHFTPMFSEYAILEGAFVFFHDITEVLNAKKNAEQASQAKSSFLATMSHEIRTPLNAIIGMTAIAKETNDMERKDYCLNKIEGASTHLLGVINDILDMSKIEADKFELSYTEFDFRKMLRQVINVIDFRLEEKKQRLVVKVDPAIPRAIVCDEQRLAQVIANLVSNAVKFTPDKGAITIDARKSAETGRVCTLEIRVTDTGIGISTEQQAKIFRSFEQVDSSIARKYGGTGLGLAISKAIVEMMHGTIRIESKMGHGSSFIVTVEVEQGDAAAPEPAEVPPGADQNHTEQVNVFAGRHILLAEDIEINREIVTSILESTELIIDEAENGRIAYELFVSSPATYDLILMDIHMPEMDGYEATRQIRAFNHPWAKSIPIIAMTANVFREDIERCTGAGMNSHLGKPLNLDDLLATLKKYLAI
ncbi:MAG: response regulator [Treponema sp.]|jgi:signal transduction histidine kinase|nr:response regulator [Treponema sp.]